LLAVAAKVSWGPGDGGEPGPGRGLRGFFPGGLGDEGPGDL